MRFQPTQGPGLGLKLAQVSARIRLNAAVVEGEVVQLRTDAGNPYAQSGAIDANDQKHGMLGVCREDGALNDEMEVQIQGKATVLLAGTVAVDAYLAVNGAGALVVATSGLPVRARALEAGVSGDLIHVDFFGDGSVSDFV